MISGFSRPVGTLIYGFWIYQIASRNLRNIKEHMSKTNFDNLKVWEIQHFEIFGDDEGQQKQRMVAREQYVWTIVFKNKTENMMVESW